MYDFLPGKERKKENLLCLINGNNIYKLQLGKIALLFLDTSVLICRPTVCVKCYEGERILVGAIGVRCDCVATANDLQSS